MIWYSAIQLAYFSKKNISFWYKRPLKTLLIWHSAVLYCSRAVAFFPFVQSLHSKCCWKSASLAIYFWDVGLSLLLLQEAPEQMWLTKVLLKKSALISCFKEWRHCIWDPFVVNQSWILINFEEQKGPAAGRNGVFSLPVWKKKKQRKKNSFYEFQDHTDILTLLEKKPHKKF